MQELKIIDSFKGEYEKFSNFYPVVIHFDGLKFPSVEHAFAASKTHDRMLKYKISQIPADQAGRAKRFGRKLHLVENWEIIKVPTMKKLVVQKFSYPEFKEFILSTKDALLVEGNYWHDNFWGDCKCQKCVDIIGENYLGKILMDVRGMLI